MRENLRLFALQLLLRLLMALHRLLQVGMNWTWGTVHVTLVRLGIEEPAESAPAIPYDLIDENLHALIRILNTYPAVRTVSSCGGHENPGPGQSPAGEWDVFVEFERDANGWGWGMLEMLVWAINTAWRDMGHNVTMQATAPPPHLNGTNCLSFCIQGRDNEDPDALAEWLRWVLDELILQ